MNSNFLFITLFHILQVFEVLQNIVRYGVLLVAMNSVPLEVWK